MIRKWFTDLRSLNAKLLVLYLPLISISLLGLFGVLETTFYRQERANLLSTLESVTDLQRAALTAAVWEYDIEHVDAVLNDLARLPDLEGAVVRDATGETLSMVGNLDDEPESPEFQIEVPLTYVSGSVEEPIGALIARVHSDRIWEEVNSHLKTNAIILVVLLGSIMGVTFFTTRYVIGRPISALQRVIQVMHSDGVREEVDWSSADELGQVVIAYNDLQAAQEAAEQEVRRYQDDLEQLVAERTAELSAASEKLGLALKNMSDGIFVVDNNLRYVMFNQRYAEMLAVPDGMIGEGKDIETVVRHMYERGDYGEDVGEEIIDTRLQHLREGADTTVEIKVPHGAVYELRHAPLREGGTVVVSTDITERKRNEVELMVAKTQAESATRAKSQFLATMSHEIRTPMNGVVGMIDLMRETKMDADQQQMLRTIRDSAFALLHIINDILDFSKIEAGKLELESIPVSMPEIVEGVVETLLPNAVNKELRVLSYIDPAIPSRIQGDPVRLRQILFNIAGNAVKFTEHKDGKRGSVWIQAHAEGENAKDGIRLTIRDTGIGMSKKAVADLFTPFTQAESSTVRRFGGTGLGLSICQNLVKMMKGEIKVESTEGVGSTFSVILPLPVAPESQQVSDGSDLSDLNVMVVVSPDNEDEAIAIDYAASRGANVTRVDTLEDAANQWRETAKQDKPCDIMVLASEWGATANQAMIDGLRGDSGGKAPRFLVFNNDRDSKKGMVLPDMMVVESEPLRWSQLLRGIAIAAGRASPDVHDDNTREEESKRKAPTVDEAEAMGELILLAEDNLTNQDVIKRQLASLGYACDIANNGREALDQLGEKNYAILLSDCHMPEMDGFGLTAKVREQERGGDYRLPIIAITANALQGEADRCLEAGMDDYLSKPVEMTKLRQTLKRWMDHAHAINGTTPAAPDAEPASEEAKPVEDAAEKTTDETTASTDTGSPDMGGDSPIDLSSLQSMFGDDPEIIGEILQDFVVPSRDIVQEIKSGYDNRAEAEVAAAAHKLKSSSRAVGANALADLCLRLEMAGKEGNWEEIEAAFPDVEPLMDQVATYIESM